MGGGGGGIGMDIETGEGEGAGPGGLQLPSTPHIAGGGATGVGQDHIGIGSRRSRVWRSLSPLPQAADADGDHPLIRSLIHSLLCLYVTAGIVHPPRPIGETGGHPHDRGCL